MSSNFPTGLDNFTNPTPTDPLNTPSHAEQHANANDAIEAIETLLGANGETIYVEVAKRLNPVGTIREFNVSTNPATLLGFGTWTAYGTGRVTVAIDAGQTEFNTAGKTGGAKTHKLTIQEMPSHNHAIEMKQGDGQWTITASSDGATSFTGITSSTGGNVAHNNLSPYIVTYRWIRTA